MAIAEPGVALLSALAHARHDTDLAFFVAQAAMIALDSVSGDRLLYYQVIRAALGPAARKAFD